MVQEVCMAGGHVWWGGMCGEGGAYMAGGMHGMCGRGGMHGRGDICGRGCVWWGHAWQGDMHGSGGMRGREWACMARETTTAADGTHPTGMHSRFFFLISVIHMSIFGATDNPVLDFW